MRLKLASWLCLALSFGVAQAQTPGTFAPNSQLGSTPLNGAFGAKADAANPVISGTLTLGGTGITGFGSAIGQALGPLVNYQGSGFPGLLLSDRLLFARQTPGPNDFADITIQRDTTSAFTGGTGANINAVLRVQGTYGAGDHTTNWTSFVRGTTNQDFTGGPMVANYIQGFRGATGQQAFWTSVLESRDLTHLASSAVAGQQVTQEVDVIAGKADDHPNAGGVGGGAGAIGNRKGIHFVIARDDPSDATPMEVSNGIWFASKAPTVERYLSMIGVAFGTEGYSFLDARGANRPTGTSNPLNALTMTAGAVVDFNGGTTYKSAPGNYLWYDTSVSRWKYTIAGVDKFSVDASGNARFAGTVTASVTP